MRYVLDSSVAVKFELEEVDSDKAVRLRDEARQGLHTLMSPDIIDAEVAHAVTRAERQGRILHGEGLGLWLAILAQVKPILPYRPLVPRAIVIASAHRIGVYDCVYVALAEREGCELVTADDRLIRNLGARFPFIVPLASLP